MMSEAYPKVMVAGATGYIGGGVLQVLHQQGFRVRALCRDPKRLKHPEWCDEIFVGQATQPDTLQGLCTGIDVVFSSIGTRSFQRKPTLWEVDYQGNLNILEAAKAAGVKQFIFVSVIHGPEMARLSPIAAAREKVVAAIQQSGMDYTIFAPTGFFNDMAEFLMAAQRKGTLYLFGDGSGTINPLSALDLGDEVVRVIQEPQLRNQVRSIGGCETFTHRQIAELAFQVVGKTPRIKTIPARAVSLLALLLYPFNYNAYALFKFFEFIARTPDVTGEAIGRRQLKDFFQHLAQGMTLVEVDRTCSQIPDLAEARRQSMVSQSSMQQLRKRFERFAELREQYGSVRAMEIMRSGQAEVEKQRMEPLIRDVPLAEAFRQAIPLFEEFGMKMVVVDISNQGQDAVLEIQRVCPYRALAAEFGLETPCQITCDMEVQAIQQAFPGMTGRILSKLPQGDCVCLFKYERQARAALPEQKTLLTEN